MLRQTEPCARLSSETDEVRPAMTAHRSRILGVLALGAMSCAGSGDDIAETTDAVSPSISATNTIGRVLASGNGLAHTFHSYDARGRTIATQHVLDGSSYVHSSTYGFPCASDACTATVAATNGST